MRVIEAFDAPVRAVAVSPDGRFLAGAGLKEITVWHLATGEVADRIHRACDSQFTFSIDGRRLLYVSRGQLYQCTIGLSDRRCEVPGPRHYAGAIAMSPDGKTLVAPERGERQQVKLARWEYPSWRPTTGFDFWSPFVRLAFSPNGEFLAGIDRNSFELRFAVSGGLNCRQRLAGWAHSLFLAFAPDSQSAIFGRDNEIHIMETRAGNILRRIESPGQRFTDAVFIGTGRMLATVDGTPVLRFWSAESWELVREYDWGAGGLTCLVAAADGLAGVCGTDAGRLVVFDVDE
jgi:WD40 repeat protein